MRQKVKWNDKKRQFYLHKWPAKMAFSGCSSTPVAPLSLELYKTFSFISSAVYPDPSWPDILVSVVDNQKQWRGSRGKLKVRHWRRWRRSWNLHFNRNALNGQCLIIHLDLEACGVGRRRANEMKIHHYYDSAMGKNSNCGRKWKS